MFYVTVATRQRQLTVSRHDTAEHARRNAVLRRTMHPRAHFVGAWAPDHSLLLGLRRRLEAAHIAPVDALSLDADLDFSLPE